MNSRSISADAQGDYSGRTMGKSTSVFGGFVEFLDEKVKAGDLADESRLEAMHHCFSVVYNAGLPSESELLRGQYEAIVSHAVKSLKEFLDREHPEFRNEVDLLYRRFLERNGPDKTASWDH